MGSTVAILRLWEFYPGYNEKSKKLCACSDLCLKKTLQLLGRKWRGARV